MSFFGELYLRSTRPLLGPEQSRAEGEYLGRAFDRLEVPGPILDLGCGHGRHVSRLQHRWADRAVIGLELDPLALAEREGSFPAVRADLASLPFRDASLAGAYAWYSTLFLFEEDLERRIFSEVARCLAPGAMLVLQTVPFERLERSPTASFERDLPDGSRLRETSRFDPLTGIDEGERELTLPDGRTLRATYFVRYRRLPELRALLARNGLSIREVHGGLQREPPSGGSTDLIVLARRENGSAV